MDFAAFGMTSKDFEHGIVEASINERLLGFVFVYGVVEVDHVLDEMFDASIDNSLFLE